MLTFPSYSCLLFIYTTTRKQVLLFLKAAFKISTVFKKTPANSLNQKLQ